MSPHRVPPQAPMQFTHTPSSLIAAAEQIRAAAVAVTEEVATTIRPEHATFQNAILPLAESENQRLHLQRTLTLYGAVHPSKELREAAGVVGAIFSNIEMDLQRDEIVSIFDHIRRREWESLDGESRRYLDRKTRAFLEAGLTIPKGPNRDRFQDIKRQIYLLGKTCRGNLSSPEHGLWLTLQELDGVSGDVLEALEACHTEKNAVMVWVTFKTPILEAVMRSAKRSSTRRLVYTYNENRCLENAPLQKEIFGLRDEAARLLGYPSRAAFKIEAKLAKTPENVYQFLREFQNWEKANAESEKRNMIAMKKAFLIQHPQESWDDPDRLFLWDMSFYRRLLLRTDEVGEDERVEHFPLGPTLNSILAKLGSFFGMEFLQVTSDGYKSALAGPGKEHTLLWCDDATMFTVWDDESAGGEFLGYLYFDLHPREYKTDHKVTISVQMGSISPEGVRRYPSSVVLNSYPRPTARKPTLLNMDEAISLLHETCHGLHSLACKTKYAELHGTSVARDFVEIPPMVVENLFSIVRFVKDVSCHYSHTSEEYARMWREDQIAKDGEHVQDIDQVPLPPRQLSDEIIDALIRRRRMKKQSANLSTLHHSLFDMAMHDPESHAEIEAMDLTETWNKLRKTATLLDGPEVLGEGWRWGAGHTRLQNINIGYDAGYYTYLTSQIFAIDIFDSAINSTDDSVLHANLKKFRYEVLQKGGTVAERTIVEDFLGRKCNMDAFCRSFGVVGGANIGLLGTTATM